MADTYVHRAFHGDIQSAETLTFAGQPANNDTVTIDGKLYVFQSALTDVDGHVLIDGILADTIANLEAAIELGAGAGTKYATLTTLHPTVEAAVTPTTLVATAKVAGAAGDLIGVSEVGANTSWGNPTLQGGFDEAYVYWVATAWDPTGSSYAGTPAFGALTGVVVTLFVPDGGGGGGGGTAAVENFEISGPGDTVHNLAQSPLPSTLIVFLNGVRLRAGVGNDYTISGTAITVLIALEAGDLLGASYEF